MLIHTSPRSLRLLRQVEALRPRNADELHRFVQRLLGIDVPRQAIVDGNTSPFEYLAATFF